MRKRIYLIILIVLFVLFIVFEILDRVFQNFEKKQENEVKRIAEHQAELKRIRMVFKTIASYAFMLFCFFLMGDLITFLISLLSKTQG